MMIRRKKQAGFTLIETAVVIALLGLIVAPLTGIIYHLIWIPGERSDVLTVLHDVRYAVRWITEDARQATTFTAGAEPDYGTFTWTDRSSDPTVSYTVRYHYSDTDDRLMREQTINGDPQTTEDIAIADNIQDYTDISIEESSGLITASITSGKDSARNSITRTGSVEAKMRPEIAVDGTYPPPYTLAWDDFESGGASGGSGWLWDWYSEGHASIVSTNNPYEGTYHAQLTGGDGYADRALDLTGQSNIRLQFWAKAYSFDNSSETVSCRVSSDGQSWDTVRTWVDVVDDDNVYRFEDIDLSSYSMTDEFYIAFDATDLSGTYDFFWFDDLKVIRTWQAE